MKYKSLDEISRELATLHKKLNLIIIELNNQIEKEKKKMNLIEKYKEQSKLVSQKIKELESELL